jgi:2-C-methyl-D-erythritol 4-phosphate cytidylyltransferase/2-C-methyl-D-erythritol 2,4-cyclodiphosphate synthase
MSLWAVIVAAGSSTRLAGAAGGTRKQYIEYAGAPLYWTSVRTMARLPELAGVVLVVPEADVPDRSLEVSRLAGRDDPGIEIVVAPGGARRQDSVASGLAKLPQDCTRVFVHDAARPFFTPELAHRVLDALDAGAAGAVPALPVTDTIKRVDENDIVTDTLVRAELRAVQTPQGFDLAILRRAHEDTAFEATDDASQVERLGERVVCVVGEVGNVKITTPEDLRLVTGDDKETTMLPLTGFGYDVHKYGPGRPMVLGTVPIPGAPEVIAHSDGDVLLHALADAILGCLGEGDIGRWFPDTDTANDNMASSIIVSEVLARARERGVRVVHADLTIVCQTPKISPHAANIAKNVARQLGLDTARVNVKATTEEKMGFTGEKRGIKCYAVVSALAED